MEEAGRNPFMPLSEVWLSLRWFSWTSDQ